MLGERCIRIKELELAKKEATLELLKISVEADRKNLEAIKKEYKEQ